MVLVWAFETCREIQLVKLGGARVQRLIKHKVLFPYLPFFHANHVKCGTTLLIKLENTCIAC